jgi:hypothetical protein
MDMATTTLHADIAERVCRISPGTSGIRTDMREITGTSIMTDTYTISTLSPRFTRAVALCITVLTSFILDHMPHITEKTAIKDTADTKDAYSDNDGKEATPARYRTRGSISRTCKMENNRHTILTYLGFHTPEARNISGTIIVIISRDNLMQTGPPEK